MNQEKFQKFSEAYKVSLETAVAKHPERYFTQGASPKEYAEVVSKRMLDHIASGKHMSINYDSDGFKLACKALGFKFSRKAILAYLEIGS